MCVAVPTDDDRNSHVFNGARTTKSTRTIFFLPRTLRQSLSCVLIPFPCVLPGSRVEFCQWCALVRCSPFCLTFLFVPFAPRHHTSPSRRRADRCWPSAGLRGCGRLLLRGHRGPGQSVAPVMSSRPAATCPHGCPRLPRNRARRVAQSPTGERR